MHKFPKYYPFLNDKDFENMLTDFGSVYYYDVFDILHKYGISHDEALSDIENEIKLSKHRVADNTNAGWFQTAIGELQYCQQLSDVAEIISEHKETIVSSMITAINA